MRLDKPNWSTVFLLIGIRNETVLFHFVCLVLVLVSLTALDVDFYTSNFHKWAFGPKGSAFLYFNSKHTKHVQSLVVGHEWLSSPQKQYVYFFFTL
jgi:selenocysteine lyase/cysteine desulfurase